MAAEGRVNSPGSLRFPRACRLGKNRNYRYVYRKGKRYPSRSFVLVYLRAKDLKIGFSVSAKVGNAVIRNRIRRCMREDIRHLRPRLKYGKYIFVARTQAAQISHEALMYEILRTIDRAQLLKEDV